VSPILGLVGFASLVCIACTGTAPITSPQSSACGISLAARVPGSSSVALSSCAGLIGGGTGAGAAIRLKVGDRIILSVTPGFNGLSGFFSDTQTVLAPVAQGSFTFVAHKPGTAKIFVTTPDCIVHNGEAAACEVTSVVVTR